MYNVNYEMAGQKRKNREKFGLKQFCCVYSQKIVSDKCFDEGNYRDISGNQVQQNYNFFTYVKKAAHKQAI